MSGSLPRRVASLRNRRHPAAESAAEQSQICEGESDHAMQPVASPEVLNDLAAHLARVNVFSQQVCRLQGRSAQAARIIEAERSLAQATGLPLEREDFSPEMLSVTCLQRRALASRRRQLRRDAMKRRGTANRRSVLTIRDQLPPDFPSTSSSRPHSHNVRPASTPSPSLPGPPREEVFTEVRAESAVLHPVVVQTSSPSCFRPSHRQHRVSRGSTI